MVVGWGIFFRREVGQICHGDILVRRNRGGGSSRGSKGMGTAGVDLKLGKWGLFGLFMTMRVIRVIRFF